MFDTTTSGDSVYCSAFCKSAGNERVGKEIAHALVGSVLMAAYKLVGIVLRAQLLLIKALFYTFPRFLKQKNKLFLFAYIFFWVLLIFVVMPAMLQRGIKN
jgi:hypothetical protein